MFELWQRRLGDMSVQAFETKGLATAWEGMQSLRPRVRDHGKLILHPKSQKVAGNTIKNAVLNRDVLHPCMVRLRQARGKLPVIDRLVEECRSMYGKCGREPDDLAESKDAWSIRRMLSWLKRKCKREEIGKASRGLKCPLSLSLASEAYSRLLKR